VLLNFSSSAQEWEWLRPAGGLGSDKGTTVRTDTSGNVIFTGFYNEEGNFGPFNTGFSNPHSKETFVCKMDPDGNFLWVTYATNYYDDRGLGLTTDESGNSFVTGTCWDGLNWPPLNVYPPGAGADQIYVSKVDPDGNVLWLKVAPTVQPFSDDHGDDMATDSQGNIFVTGFISNWGGGSSAFFDAIETPILPGDSLAFVAKMDNLTGDWEWVRTFDGIHSYRDNGIAVDDEDNVYVAGGFKGVAQFGPETLNSTYGTLDIYVLKYANDGTFQYVIQVADSLDARADQICYGKDGHMYVTGEFRNEVVFGTDDLNNYGSPGDRDIFVSKLTKDGQWVWATKAGSKKGGDRGIGICANDKGNVYVCGQYKDTAKFGDHLLYAGNNDLQLYVGMINQLGEWQWVLDGGGLLADRAASVAADNDCNVYVTGFYRDSMTAGPHSLTSFGGTDIFIAKISDACNGEGPQPPDDPGDEEDVFNFQPTNVFTPNGDGVNDLLYLCKDCSVSGHVTIVNRWGNVVYESNDVSAGWNGNTPLGIPVEDGTYFYKLDVQFKTGEKDSYSGFITVTH
jgi:gliding motility-associated-like protein